jgi:predicted nucleotidyltransferase
MMQNIIQANLLQIQQLMRTHHVAQAYAFGSAITGNMHQDSDVDFVITFAEGLDYKTYGDSYFNLLYALQNLLHREVDLVAEETLTNPYLLQSINNQKLQVL